MFDNLLRIVVLAFIPCAVWLYIYYRKDFREPEPIRLIWKTFGYGMLVAIPLVGVRLFMLANPRYDIVLILSRSLHNNWLVYIVLFSLVAIVEEYLKHVGMVRTVEQHQREFNQVLDGIEYAVASALGFAFVENVIYLFDGVHDTSLGWAFLGIFIVRAMSATLGHTLFSGFFGYFYAKAKLTPNIIQHDKNPHHHFHKHLGEAMKFHVMRTHIIPNRPSKRGHDVGVLIAEGFLLAVILHFTYNMLAATSVAGKSLTPLLIPFLFAGFILLGNEFNKRANYRIVKRVKERVHTALAIPEIIQRRRIAKRAR